MEHTRPELIEKLKGMYPEIEKHGISLDAEFIKDKDYWIVKLEKGLHKLHTHLETKDADACLEGVQCLYLGMQIGQFVKNFESLK